jgi:Zn-dependent protease with chaperone function
MAENVSDDIELECYQCGTANRFSKDRALEDLTKVRCGRPTCRTELLLARGEPLAGLDAAALTHPFDRTALEALQAIPLMDKIIAKVMGATFDQHMLFQHMASSVRVSESQMPRLWALYLEACGRIDVSPVPLFVSQSPTLNASAAGAGSPVISVTTGLLDALDDREILGVLGHELTHVKLGHVLYRTLAHMLMTGGLAGFERMLGIGALLIKPVQLALYRWVQMAELSADRGELIAVGCLHTTVSAHLRLSGGSKRFEDDTSVEAFMAQADEADKMREESKLLWTMEMLESSRRTHPFPAWRVHHVRAFARSESFFHLLAGTPTLKLTH